MTDYISLDEYHRLTKAKPRTGRPAQSEHAEQVTLVDTIATHASARPALRLLYAIPNGGHRGKRTAALLKAEGVRAGLPDLCLPVARGGYIGCYLEGKIKGGRVRPEQRAWLDALAAEGHYTAVFWSADEGIDLLLRYERGEVRRPA